MAKILENLLADYGYNIVALPKADIKPLMLLAVEGDAVASLGNSLTDLFDIDETPPPQLFKDVETSDLTGSTAVSYEAGGGLSVLDWLLDKLKMGKLEGKVNFDNNKVLTIKYEKVLEDKINLLDLDNFMSGSLPSKNKFNTYKTRLENSELYVINSVLKSNAFSVTIEDKNGSTAEVAATVKGILNANANFTSNKDNTLTIKNENENPLVFAFKSQRILYDKKEWWQFFKKESAGFTIKNQTGLVLKDESAYPTIRLEPRKTDITL